MNSQFYYMFYVGFVQFISLFTPPVTLEIVYPISYMGVFLFHFHLAQAFVYLYIQYVYTFQLHNIEGVQTSTLRWKSFCWKIFLTILIILVVQPCRYNHCIAGQNSLITKTKFISTPWPESNPWQKTSHAHLCCELSPMKKLPTTPVGSTPHTPHNDG